jgi:hypothetical protein
LTNSVGIFISIRSANSNEDPSTNATYFGSCPGGYLILSGVLIMPTVLMILMELIPYIKAIYNKLAEGIKKIIKFQKEIDIKF